MKSIPFSVKRNARRNPTIPELQQMSRHRRYYYRHREKMLQQRLENEYGVKYRKEHKKYFAQKNKEKWNKWKENGYAEWSTNHSRKNRLKLFKILGGAKCKECGYEDVRALQLDHINGGGNKERKKRGERTFYAWYANRPELAKKTLQVLCANCNWVKRFENDENSKGWNLGKK